MARKSRIHYPGAVYHVMLRGNGGQDIFFSPADRTRLFLLMQEGVHRFGDRIHAFCLMSNHIHLAIQVADVPLSKIIQNISFRYTRWINRKRRKTGHLFQGRYKALLVDMDSYLLELVRYIHLNPVRAGLVKRPDSYQWSGHNCYLGKETLPWLAVDWVLGQFGKDLTTARHSYAKFINDGPGLERDNKFHQGSEADSRVLGDDVFLDRIFNRKASTSKKPSIHEIESAVCLAFSLSSDKLRKIGTLHKPAQARALIGLVATQLETATLTETSKYFQRDVATLSTGIKRLTAKIKNSGLKAGPWSEVLQRFNVKP
jgi:REP element-mobilizing transposase RayT